MADLAAMRTAFGRLGFSAAAAAAIVNEQAIDSVKELRLLSDKEVENLCKVVRRPGGTIPNPNAGQAGAPGTLPNPGIPIALRAENNMKLAAYWCRFRSKTSRATGPNDIELDPIRQMRDLREWEEAHEDTKPQDNIINAKDWHKTLEALEEYLRGCLGVTQIPLAYVIRKDEAITADPAPNQPSRGWPSMQDELIGRAPIIGADGTHTQTYLTDRAAVWEKIAALTRDKACWTYVKVAQRTRDGRTAIQALTNHYLGENMTDMIATSAERKLATTTYSGEKRRWTFEKYASLHVEQHGILEGLAAKNQHVGIDERSKVRYLLDGVKTKEYDSIKAQILSDATLRNSFDRCVNLYQDYIHQMQQQGVATSNLSAVGTRAGEQDGSERSPDKKRVTFTIHEKDVKDRYYNAKEYSQMSPNGRKKLKRIREDRGHASSKKKKGNDQPDRYIQALATSIASAMADKGTDTQDDASGAGSNNQTTSNRDNPALTRQRGGGQS